MALERRVTLDNGIQLNNAYSVITWIEGNTERMVLHLSTFANKEAYLNNLKAVDITLYEFVPDTAYNAKNYHIQGYEHLKNLPEFEGAVEVD